MATKRQRRKRRRRVAEAPGSGEPLATPAPAQAAPTARRRKDGPPPAPWGDFPLSEIVVFIGIVLLIAGFFVPPAIRRRPISAQGRVSAPAHPPCLSAAGLPALPRETRRGSGADARSSCRASSPR